MNKDQAIQAAVGGKFVKRKDWPSGQYLFMVDGHIYLAQKDKDPERYKIKDTLKDGKKVPNPDRSATDWELCEGAVLPVSKEAAEDNDADNADNGKVSATFVNNKSTAKPQQL
jgi:hypothetical protein